MTELSTDQARKPVTAGVFDAVLKEIAVATREFIKNKLSGHSAQIQALDARVKQLEARPLPKWMGTWEERSYFEGNLVTRSGGLWLATKNTAATPGDESGEWRLIVKSAR